ncbi:hypothetical protein BS78_04G059400 [Paspalum vaginatum]|nr:hypothetical protein BS78_04G059400 [Paspalum vaginatum]
MTAAKVARRYALLLALWDTDYARKVYGGYHNVFVAAFGDGERWDCFRVIAGEFPAPEDLASYDGFVVSGSPEDAHGDEPWKRVLGVCFGHQVLCRALGGTVGKARGGWDVGVRQVTFVRDRGMEGFGFLAGRLEELPRSANIIEVHVHQDEVWEIPAGATAFAVGEHALGIQGHPEYTTGILHNLIDRLTGRNDIPRRVGEDARRTSFLRGGGRTNGCGRSTAAVARGGEPVTEVVSNGGGGCCFSGATPMVRLACHASIN